MVLSGIVLCIHVSHVWAHLECQKVDASFMQVNGMAAV